MAKKKRYLLAPKTLIFDELEQLIDFLEKQQDILSWKENYVMGSYIGELEVQKKISFKNLKKTFLIDEKKTEPINPIPPSLQQKHLPENAQIIKNSTICYFDDDPAVKLIYVKGKPVGLCDVHVDLEKSLVSGEVSLDEL